MILRRLPQIALALLAASAVLLVVLYAVRPTPKHESSASALNDRTMVAQTAFAPVVALPTWTPTPSPDSLPRLVDVASGDVRTVALPAGDTLQHVFADGSFLVSASGFERRVLNRDGTLRSLLGVPVVAHVELSRDNRYAAWVSDGRLHVYDAVTAQITESGVPAGARFDHALPDGALLIATIVNSSDRTALVDSSGTVVDTLDPVVFNIAPSPDGMQLAWPGMSVYNRATRTTRVYADVKVDVANLAWSPDGTEIAYGRLSDASEAHVWVVDVASGAQHEVHAGSPNVGLRNIKFTAAHDLQFEVLNSPASLFADVPGAMYAVSDTGAGRRFVDREAAAWAMCGARCGVPPVAYADNDGIAAWCEPSGNGPCARRLTFVDRSRAIAHDLPAEDEMSIAVSPDGRYIAITARADVGDETLRIIDTDGFSERDVGIGYSLLRNIAWLPGSRDLVLFDFITSD